MPYDEERVARIVADADKMVGEIQGKLDAGEATFRQFGVDRGAFSASIKPEHKEEAARLLAEDQAAIDREVDEEKARLSFSTPVSGTRPAKKRMMI
ncbi:MAG: hypothetical protein H6R18_419 [Proteobacteria bacterium]|nr:hypothetical protein [Pseudomonadota bacterium]